MAGTTENYARSGVEREERGVERGESGVGGASRAGVARGGREMA